MAYGSHSYGSRGYGSGGLAFLRRIFNKGTTILLSTLESVITPFKKEPTVILQCGKETVANTGTRNAVLTTKKSNITIQ